MSVEAARARFEHVAFANTLGVTVRELADDRAVLSLPFRPDNLNARGVLQGGASASLVTLAGTLAAWTYPRSSTCAGVHGIERRTRPGVWCSGAMPSFAT